MQQNSACSDMASPYMLWQYVNLMAPCKSSEYNIHPAFTHTSPHTIQSMAYIQDQYVSNINYRMQHQQYHRHAPNHHDIDNSVIYTGQQFPVEPNHLLQNENQSLKKHGKPHTNINALKRMKSNQTALPIENTQIITHISPKKAHSFTIDAILNKGERGRPVVESSTTVVSVRKPTMRTSNSVGSPARSGASTPQHTTPCSPSDAMFSIPPPLMHSTPTSYNPHVALKRHGRYLNISHPYPYFIQQYESTDIKHQDLTHSYPHILPSNHIASSLSSGSSSSSLSTPSSTSTSPESAPSSRNDKPDRRSGGKTKRVRTIFTPDQLERLEAEFERQQYMVGTERFYLATSLNLTEAQVKVWFQNRRIKWRKQHLEQQQARLAHGDLYRDLDEESGDTDMEEHNIEFLTHDAGQSSSARESDQTSL